MIEAWAFIDESGRVFVHPFATDEGDVWNWALTKRLGKGEHHIYPLARDRIDQLKANGCRVALVRIEILEDGE